MLQGRGPSWLLGSPSHHEEEDLRTRGQGQRRGRSLLCSSTAAPGRLGKEGGVGMPSGHPRGQATQPTPVPGPVTRTARTKETGNSGGWDLNDHIMYLSVVTSAQKCLRDN